MQRNLDILYALSESHLQGLKIVAYLMTFGYASFLTSTCTFSILGIFVNSGSVLVAVWAEGTNMTTLLTTSFRHFVTL